MIPSFYVRVYFHACFQARILLKLGFTLHTIKSFAIGHNIKYLQLNQQLSICSTPMFMVEEADVNLFEIIDT